MTINRLILDELREHKDFTAWDAATPATNAVADAQIWAMTNQGEDGASSCTALRLPPVLHRAPARATDRLGLFEWSAPDRRRPDRPGRARPWRTRTYGRRTDPEALRRRGAARESGGAEELASFRTEILCQRVDLLDPAIDPDAWAASGGGSTDFSVHRGRVALCLDVALDGTHASLVAAAVTDGKVHVAIAEHWSGRDCTQRLRAELPGIVERIRPRTIGWFPNGPAAALAAQLKERRGWPPRRVVNAEIRGDIKAVCMGMAEQVLAGEVVHPDDPMLNSHVSSAQRMAQGDGWVFVRRGASAIDGAYALAGAVHLARTLPPPPPPLTAL
jgi:hypothetical protein